MVWEIRMKGGVKLVTVHYDTLYVHANLLFYIPVCDSVVSIISTAWREKAVQLACKSFDCIFEMSIKVLQ